ncbi:hypothetical protein ACRYCC_38470 [Actinomadura scrupuli]|uniref:hypothetical protein n=1 Tax=Actinomadura scrupuli TaxID=559629 RepID=UPI003D95ACAF
MAPRTSPPRIVAAAVAAAGISGIVLLAVTGGAAALADSPAHVTSAGGQALTGKPKEGHVTGDAWVRFSVDPGNPLRRFIFDAHGNAFKFVDGKLVMGDAHGTVRFNHPAEDPDGVVRDHWGTVDVDYVMTGGPVAVVSGTSSGNVGWPKGTRMSFSVYADPRGHEHDRMGFSGGVVDGRCHRMGMAPAPFTSYVSGKGYTVKHADVPLPPEGAEGPADPPPCTGA